MQKEGARKSPMDIINPLLNPFYIKRTCPKCIQEFYPGDCRIVSTITHGKELKPAPTGWQQLVSRVMPEQIKGAYVLELAYRECPHCQYPLPANIELVDNINIAIIGDTFSGKSHYMAALIHQIRQGLLQRADRYARFACLTQKVEGDFIRDVLNPLFKDKISPPLTQKVTPPLIYELIMAPSPEHPARRLNLILHDTPGEKLADQANTLQEARYVLNADAIVFLADPMSMEEIFDVLPPFLQKKPPIVRPALNVLNSVITLLENYRGLGAGARLSSTPIAITLPKSDLLKQLTTVQKPFSFLKQPVYNGSINLEDIQRVDQEVRELLEGYNQRALLAATQKFAKVNFFATSATGYAPDKNNVYPAVEPCRCLDPILWILYQLDVIHAYS